MTQPTTTFTLRFSWDEQAKIQREALASQTDWNGYFSIGDKQRQAGGNFQVVKQLTSQEVSFLEGNGLYALTLLAEKIEALSGKKLDELKAMYMAHDVNYILYHYFDSVEEPKEGDLVVYNQGRHLALCHSTASQKPAVVSCWNIWNNADRYILIHDPFFLPSHAGSVAQFYRIKQKAHGIRPVQEAVQNQMGAFRKDGTFVFDNQSHNFETRLQIWDSSDKEKANKPAFHLQMLAHIDFVGVCYQYAMGKLFNTYSMPACVPHFEKNEQATLALFKNYFELTQDPQDNDLVLYYNQDPETNDIIPVHYGVFIDNRVESKWGACGKVWLHPPFYVTPEYGNYIRFLRMKFPRDEILKTLTVTEARPA